MLVLRLHLAALPSSGESFSLLFDKNLLGTQKYVRRIPLTGGRRSCSSSRTTSLTRRRRRRRSSTSLSSLLLLLLLPRSCSSPSPTRPTFSSSIHSSDSVPVAFESSRTRLFLRPFIQQSSRHLRTLSGSCPSSVSSPPLARAHSFSSFFNSTTPTTLSPSHDGSSKLLTSFWTN